MAYNKHTWRAGEKVTSAKLNNIESGIEAASSGAIGEQVEVPVEKPSDGVLPPFSIHQYSEAELEERRAELEAKGYTDGPLAFSIVLNNISKSAAEALNSRLSGHGNDTSWPGGVESPGVRFYYKKYPSLSGGFVAPYSLVVSAPCQLSQKITTWWAQDPFNKNVTVGLSTRDAAKDDFISRWTVFMPLAPLDAGGEALVPIWYNDNMLGKWYYYDESSSTVHPIYEAISSFNENSEYYDFEVNIFLTHDEQVF